MGHGREEGARSHGGAAGSMGRGEVRDSEAGSGDKGSSSHDADGDWQTRGDPTAQMWAEGEQRGCQNTAVAKVRTGAEVVGEGGWAGVQNAQGGFGMVCATHTHHKATPSIGSDRGKISMAVVIQAERSGQTDSSGTTSDVVMGQTGNSRQADSSGQTGSS